MSHDVDVLIFICVNLFCNKYESILQVIDDFNTLSCLMLGKVEGVACWVSQHARPTSIGRL